MPTITVELLEGLTSWSAPRRVTTKMGERRVRDGGAPSAAFWELWRNHKAELKAYGIAVGKAYDTGEWVLAWWAPLDAAEVASREVSRAASRATDATIDIPTPDGMKFYPFQRAGIAYALTRPHTLIADEMGLGKTAQAIGVCNATHPLRVLILCPASLKMNWQREWKRFSTLNLSIGQGNGKLPSPLPDVLVLNYDNLAKHADALAGISWDVLIADEVHYCQNPRSQRGKALQYVAQAAARRLMLTGTPIVNRPAELWPILKLIAKDEFASEWQFKARYVNRTDKLDELQRRLRETVMVRRLKADVLTELPPKTRQIVEIPVTPATAPFVARMAELDKIISECADDIFAKEGETEEDYNARLAKMGEAQRVAFTELARVRHELAFAKVPQVIEHVRESFESADDDHKIVVFAHHRDVIDAIVAGLPEYNPVRLTGEDNLRERQTAVDRFQTDDSVRLFVGNIRAAGVGFTLTESSHVVFAELDWTPAAMTQAEDRCHRIGQVDNVLVQHCVVDGSLDLKQARTIVDKQATADLALDKRRAGDVVINNATPDAMAALANELAAQAQRERAEAIAAAQAADAARRAEAEAKATAERAATAERERAGDETAITVTAERIAWAQMVLRAVAAADGDHARDLNGVGFNRLDNEFGHSLASATFWTTRQAVAGIRLAQKYRRQAAWAGDMPPA